MQMQQWIGNNWILDLIGQYHNANFTTNQLAQLEEHYYHAEGHGSNRLAGLTLGRTFAAFVIYMTFIVFHIIFHIHVWVGWVGEINIWTDGTAVASNLPADIRAGNSNE